MYFWHTFFSVSWLYFQSMTFLSFLIFCMLLSFDCCVTRLTHSHWFHNPQSFYFCFKSTASETNGNHLIFYEHQIHWRDLVQISKSTFFNCIKYMIFNMKHINMWSSYFQHIGSNICWHDQKNDTEQKLRWRLRFIGALMSQQHVLRIMLVYLRNYTTKNWGRIKRKRSLLVKNNTNLEQNSWPQFRQWCLLSEKENLTLQATQLSIPSSFIQWSATTLPGWSVTVQLNTRPLASPTYTTRWSLKSATYTTV